MEVETTGETVGEAKWLALRELERLQPGLDKAAVEFQVVSEGQRGLLGVGYAPARVLARVEEGAVASPPEAAADESDHVRRVRELVEQIALGIGVPCRVAVEETDEGVTATASGGDLALLIGKHGQTIDAIQYLVSSIVHRAWPEERFAVVVDASGYRERRRATLETLALRSAERAIESGEAVSLEPMSSVERKLVHLCLQEHPGVETSSEGAEPNRFVVISPA